MHQRRYRSLTPPYADVRTETCQLDTSSGAYSCISATTGPPTCDAGQSLCDNRICCNTATYTCGDDGQGHPLCIESTATICPDNQFGCVNNLCCQSGTETCVPNASAALGWECQAIFTTGGGETCPNGQTRVEGYDLCCPSADHYVENGTPHCGRRPNDNTPTTPNTPNTGGSSPAPGGNNQATPSRSASTTSASATRAASNAAFRGHVISKAGEISLLGLVMLMVV
ncbi:hypothetical protein M408DRAFT_26873 [Serendipita vermifera MAFF 305830]|uniref:Uncharacterized protein n=1 Tax=Serendipita vermifera MAFF 305830 TaxID=933852 RepID=A0A0C2X5J0_SERVB|nr:hypothetical protein M408DRAFT_26873 [Serendipita vermifera MAFF 305830]